MFYENGEKIWLADAVMLDTGVRGHVVGFDEIEGRGYVIVQTEYRRQVWATPNAIRKFKKLTVQSEV